MSISANAPDERVADVKFTSDALVVSLKDGRVISVPLAWYPGLLNASRARRKNWKISGGGYGIHWPDIDEDLSTEGLLRGAPAPRRSLTVNDKEKERSQVVKLANRNNEKVPYHFEELEFPMEIENIISEYITERAARGLRTLTRRDAMYNLIRVGMQSSEGLEFMTLEEVELLYAESLGTEKEVPEKEARKKRA